MRNSGSKSKNVSVNQMAIIFSVDLDEADFCKTCSDHILKRNVPNLAANYGFRYREQPSWDFVVVTGVGTGVDFPARGGFPLCRKDPSRPGRS
ncbi:hypothetical protein CDAR_309001 [Caerostris darwini]|uniref:Uncharacterized protein n=1 Tax=Caerostris darwini TaxID=1538125 RepID=A0AAV4U5U3_9ARAC|nr:hypothetical protein CDAR_309001 [Caerostris darwini]